MSAQGFRIHPPGEAIYKVNAPATPQFRFEWHKHSKAVFLIRLGVLPEVGDRIASQITELDQAYEAIQTWLRGYHEGRRPTLTPVPHKEPSP